MPEATLEFTFAVDFSRDARVINAGAKIPKCTILTIRSPSGFNGCVALVICSFTAKALIKPNYQEDVGKYRANNTPSTRS